MQVTLQAGNKNAEKKCPGQTEVMMSQVECDSKSLTVGYVLLSEFFLARLEEYKSANMGVCGAGFGSPRRAHFS